MRVVGTLWVLFCVVRMVQRVKKLLGRVPTSMVDRVMDIQACERVCMSPSLFNIVRRGGWGVGHGQEEDVANCL